MAVVEVKEEEDEGSCVVLEFANKKEVGASNDGDLSDFTLIGFLVYWNMLIAGN